MPIRELTLHLTDQQRGAIVKNDVTACNNAWELLARQLRPGDRIVAEWRTTIVTKTNRHTTVSGMEALAYVIAGVQTHRCSGLRFFAYRAAPSCHREIVVSTEVFMSMTSD